MDWQEFLEGESAMRELSTEQTKTLLVLFSSEIAHLNQIELSVKLSISEATVKQRMGEIYKKFSASFPELANHEGAGKLRILHPKLKQKYYQLSQPLPPVSNSSPYPEEFISLIKE